MGAVCEQAVCRHAREQQAAWGAQTSLRVPVSPRLGVDPDLLQLNSMRRPRGGLGLEPDRAGLRPNPGAPLVDLGAGSPTEAIGIALKRIDPDFLEMRGSARGQQ